MVGERGILIGCRSPWKVRGWFGTSVQQVPVWNESNLNISFRLLIWTVILITSTRKLIEEATMFLYWKKRGAYELESVPSSLTQVGIERFSWSSSLDVIHDLCGKLGNEPDHLTKWWIYVCVSGFSQWNRTLGLFSCIHLTVDNAMSGLILKVVWWIWTQIQQ